MKGARFLVIVILAIAIGSYLDRFVWDGVEYRIFVPNIVAPAESLGPPWLTNTLFTALIVDVVILVLALLARAGMKKDGALPDNAIAHAWEALIDVLYRNHMEPILGKRAKVVVPIAVTAFVFIFISAALVIIPGAESIGKVQPSQDAAKGWCVARTGNITLVTGVPVDEKKGYENSCGRPAPTTNGIDAARMGYSVTPFLRRPTSDMNTALALALVAFFFVEIQGLRANGWHYFKRFFPIHSHSLDVGRTGTMDGFIGNIQIVASLLELMVEFIRILSFAFRLFGSMFIGAVLVAVMASILPVLLPTIFLGLEFAAGVIQAFVFMMLITVFTTLAVAHDEG